MDTLSLDLNIHICKFLRINILALISGINKQYRTIAQKLYPQTLCRQCNLIRHKSKLSNEEYAIIINEAICADTTIGSWHENPVYWTIINNIDYDSNLSWFPVYKECSSVWWFNITFRKTFRNWGKYQIWLRAYIGTQCDFSLLINGNLTKKIISQVGFWYDYKLTTLHVTNDEEINITLQNHNSQMLKSKLIFAFLYFYPIHTDDLENIPDDEIVFLC
ncbi:MAG: hypothetical protein Harvfovirus4_8 [Harvfovirus sp.]|uniref:Uncharacterized protein n=1 Tax=Harvfovirus sp. TaxID=2487768 RepID=A0A3G5A2B0_9VIRU|nr:MAG: hypothetical protein Harvfovirus4_8 [Harvfovirus sp.]